MLYNINSSLDVSIESANLNDYETEYSNPLI